MSREVLGARFEPKGVFAANFYRVEGREIGKINEERALALLREMAEEGTFARVRRASKRQTHIRGIDMFGIVALNSTAFSEDELRIPFQIKSSFRQGRIF